MLLDVLDRPLNMRRAQLLVKVRRDVGWSRTPCISVHLAGEQEAAEGVGLGGHEIVDQNIQKLDKALKVFFSHRRGAGKLDGSQALCSVHNRDNRAAPPVVTLVPVGLGPLSQFGKMQLPGLSTVVALRVLGAGRMAGVGRQFVGGSGVRQGEGSCSDASLADAGEAVDHLM